MKIKIGFIILFFGICALNAHADTSPLQTDTQVPQTQATSTTMFNDRVNTFSISSQNFYNHYSEPEKARRITGLWDGVEGQYTFRPNQGNILNTPIFDYYAIDGLYATGKNDLEENLELLNPGPGATKQILKNIPGYMFEDRALLGRDFILLPYLRATPYTGFGIRYETNQSAGHIVTLDDGSQYYGKNFSDLYYYIPTGLTLDLAANNGYEISLNMEYDYLVKGYERSDYANYDEFALLQGDYPSSNLRYSLNHGWGDRYSLKILKHLSKVDIYFEPYIRYWHVNKSKAASGLLFDVDTTSTANKNSTLEAGSSLGVQF